MHASGRFAGRQVSGIHINQPAGEYCVRVRHPYHKRYILVSHHAEKIQAMVVFGLAMAGGQYKRGDVLFCAEWYDPIQVAELVLK